MKAQEMINYINGMNIYQTEYLINEPIIRYIDKHDGIFQAEGLSVDKHRWHETSVTVFEINGEYFGIRHVSQLYDEMSDIEDIYHTLKAFPVKLIAKPTYVIEE